MFAMMIAVVAKGVYDLGGPQAVWDINTRYDRTEMFNFNPDPFVRHTFWSVLIGQLFYWGNIYSTNQALVQRCIALPTLRKAQIALLIVWPLKTMIVFLCLVAGAIVFARYNQCDPMSVKQIQRPDQLLPLYVIEMFADIPGFVGLFIAGVFSGSLSTISSGVNSLAAVTLQDYIRPLLPDGKLSDSAATLYVKLVSVFYGLLSILLVLVAQQMGNIIQATITLFGLLGSPVFGLFTLGMFVPAANPKGAFWGTLIGIGCSLWVGVGAMIYRPYIPQKPVSVASCVALYKNVTHSTYSPELFGQPSDEDLHKNSDIPLIYQISYQCYGVIGTVVTIIAGYLISLITGRTSIADLDATLFTPVVRRRIERLQRARIENYILKAGSKKAKKVIARALAPNGDGQSPTAK
ncbi:unnamed protein product, partial [Medioppia subpectinata]